MRNSEVFTNKLDLKPLINGHEKNAKLVENIAGDIVSYITKVVTALKVIGTSLRSGELSKSSEMFTDVIEGIDWVAQLIVILKERYGDDFGKLTCNNINALELEDELLSILTELIPVHIRKDWNLIADILEHELYRNLCSWATIFPQIVELEDKVLL